MEYYFIHMATATGLTIPHSIDPISVCFFERMESYLYNVITNVDLKMLKCLWSGGIILCFNSAQQKVV